jgi:hypothetical protein
MTEPLTREELEKLEQATKTLVAAAKILFDICAQIAPALKVALAAFEELVQRHAE